MEQLMFPAGIKIELLRITLSLFLQQTPAMPKPLSKEFMMRKTPSFQEIAMLKIQ